MTTRDDERATDPGTFIGYEPEAAAETIPGGVDPADIRVSAVGTQVAPGRDGSTLGEEDPGAAVSGRRGEAAGQRADPDVEGGPPPDVIALPGPAGDPERGE